MSHGFLFLKPSLIFIRGKQELYSTHICLWKWVKASWGSGRLLSSLSHWEADSRFLNLDIFCALKMRLKMNWVFYPRPVLALEYCHRLRLCVCVRMCVCESVCQSLACPHDNLGPVQARIAKFGPKMQKTLVKVPIVLGGNWPWPSMSNLTSKSEFTPFWACPDHNSSPIQVRITKFGPEVENSLVKVPIIWGGKWPWPSRSNLIWTVEFFYQTYLRCFCKYLQPYRPSPVYI